MTPQSAQSVAILAGVLAAGVLGVLAYDLVVYLLDGHTATISHGLYELGRCRPWVPYAFVAASLALAVFLAWHFWG